jgi:hypothetical protein
VADGGPSYEMAWVDNLRIREIHDGTSGPFALDRNICRTTDSRTALIRLGRTIGDDHVERAAIDITTGAVGQAADHSVGSRREENGLAGVGGGRDASERKTGRNGVVAAVIDGFRRREINQGTWGTGGGLATDEDVARTNDIDAIRGTTAVYDHVETTLARRQSGNLDDCAGGVSPWRKDTSRWGVIRHRGRGRRVAAIGDVYGVPNVSAPNSFARGDDFRGTLDVITVIGLAPQ